MTGIYQRFPNYASPDASLPKIRADYVIDDGTIGLFDFKGGWGYPEQANPAVIGEGFRNYVDAGNEAAVGAVAIPFASGRLVFDASLSFPLTAVNLPNEWKLSAANDVAVGLWGIIKLTGYPVSGAGSATGNILGWQSGGFIQHVFQLTWDRATGNVNNVYVGWNSKLFQIISHIPTDGLPHLYVSRYTQLTSNTFQVQFYVDGVLKYTSTVQTVTGFVVPAASQWKIGNFFNSTTSPARMEVARVWMQDFAHVGSKSFADFMAIELDRNTARLT